MGWFKNIRKKRKIRRKAWFKRLVQEIRQEIQWDLNSDVENAKNRVEFFITREETNLSNEQLRQARVVAEEKTVEYLRNIPADILTDMVRQLNDLQLK